MKDNFRDAIAGMRSIETMANEDRWMNQIHPLVKLFLTIFYIAAAVSFDKYDLTGLAAMVLYLIFVYIMGELSFREAVYRLRIILPIVCAVGIFNPFFDRTVITTLGTLNVTGGVISMLTLMMKGIFSVLASNALIATTTIEKLCYAMRLLHIPKMFVTMVLLIYRYISLLLSEANRMVQAYALRAPGQKGINIRVWGPLVGQLLLRSMDRAQNVYDSMCLRGYTGEFYYGDESKARGSDYLYLLLWALLIVLFRTVPVFQVIGNLFV